MVIIWAVTWQNQQNECAPSEDSDQPGHPPSLIRVFAVRMKKAWVFSYQLSAQRRLIRLGGCPGWSESSAQRRLISLGIWSDWADAQADQSLRCAHTHFVGFVMSWLIFGNRSGQTVLEAAPVAECLRTLIFSALNRLSSHRCGFEPSSGHTWDKSSSACGWSGGFFSGDLPFLPHPTIWLG